MTTPPDLVLVPRERLPVSYDDEVTDEQIAMIEELVAPEFEGGDWVEVENEDNSIRSLKKRDGSERNATRDDGSN